ncbi:MAG: sulfatase family protein [Opitutales bacterium]
MLKRIKICAFFVSICVAQLHAVDKPNFVIVLADDVSWSSFGCNDSGLYTRTPNIDRLADQGMRFTNFSGSVAMCGPLRHELYTGLLPPSSSVYSNGSKRAGEYKNMVSYLGELGYNVGLAGKAHFSSDTPFPEIPGFTHGANEKDPTWELSGVEQFIEGAQAEGKPFCVVLGSVHAHHPWTIGNVSNFPLDKMVIPPHMVDTPMTREALATHAAEVEDLDNQVGAAMKLVDDLGLANNTVFIFLSEQGTALPNGKWSIYDFGTRALCLVRWPGKIEPATVTDAVAMYCDIMPTMVDIAGGKVSSTDGKSMLSVLKGETDNHREHAYLIHQTGGFTQRAIRNKKFKLIWTPEQENTYYLDVMMAPKSGKTFARTWREWLVEAKSNPSAETQIDRVLVHSEFELYNIQDDPWELNNLADNPEYAKVVKEMHAQIKADMASLNDVFSTVDPKAEKRERKGKEKKKNKS